MSTFATPGAVRPACTWVPVTDSNGRTVLEARWAMPAPANRRAA